MSIFRDIVAWVQRAGQNIKKLFNEIPRDIRDKVQIALQVTTRLKSALESPVADLVTALIPGDWDDRLKKEILQYLQESLILLSIVKDCAEKDNIGDMVSCWLEKLRDLPEDVRHALLIKLASLLVAKLHGNKLRESQYDLYTQLVFSAIK